MFPSISICTIYKKGETGDVPVSPTRRREIDERLRAIRLRDLERFVFVLQAKRQLVLIFLWKRYYPLNSFLLSHVPVSAHIVY